MNTFVIVIDCALWFTKVKATRICIHLKTYSQVDWMIHSLQEKNEDNCSKAIADIQSPFSIY